MSAGIVSPFLNHEQAVGFVNNLQKVTISSIAPEDMKCPFCWNIYGQVDEEGANNDPVLTPCGHLYGRDCLVQVLESSRLCPMCRSDM
ncbi:hypothetical protein P153DRAFT_369464, partial [Dothidotthia symphoricarpi CBS 119687]